MSTTILLEAGIISTLVAFWTVMALVQRDKSRSLRRVRRADLPHSRRRH